MMMKNNLVTTFMVCFLFSCSNSNPENSENKNKNISYVKSDDAIMNDAIATANNTFEEFDKAFKNNKYDTSTFAIKVKFPTKTGNEHIWATFLTIQNGDYFGTIDDLPEVTTVVKLGDRVRITKENISDWMFIDSGILRGGYTLRVIRNKFTPEERRHFDSTLSFIIRD